MHGVERPSHDAFHDQLDNRDIFGIAIRHRHNEGCGGIYDTWKSDIAYDVVDVVLGEFDVAARIYRWVVRGRNILTVVWLKSRFPVVGDDETIRIEQVLSTGEHSGSGV
ncbi:hypothetical protein EFA46_012665 (plasmid) [Halarchaeum sp. CBA1220]|uniref:hypothetical protein n=1 Tax=Halarchaeum sp. CBA1220 TaxID=1853682 RepID=UPI000F3A9190|nr:hypothetical protein [Halarchaeum sp. CBA1220]QLC35102.1 hypothetical protein EFA46_012665 [Halarchaeum sp. CBA1220]